MDRSEIVVYCSTVVQQDPQLCCDVFIIRILTYLLYVFLRILYVIRILKIRIPLRVGYRDPFVFVLRIIEKYVYRYLYYV